VPNTPITIQDVAILAQTSPSTVSNLLNGRVDRMRSETRERIERAMNELDYRPSQVAPASCGQDRRRFSG
jgi:DNA-binding LacI/PurR family transcriptional regulator